MYFALSITSAFFFVLNSYTHISQQFLSFSSTKSLFNNHQKTRSPSVFFPNSLKTKFVIRQIRDLKALACLIASSTTLSSQVLCGQLAVQPLVLHVPRLPQPILLQDRRRS